MSGTITLLDSQVTHNDGGGLHVQGNLTAQQSDISFNSINMNGYYGGGVTQFAGQLILDDVTVEDNTSADWMGSGIFTSGSNVKIADTRVISNSGYPGSGLVLINGSSGQVINSLFAQNSAPHGNGASIYSWGDLQIIHTTIADTSLNPGAAIYFEVGSLHITDTMILSHAVGILTSRYNTGVTEDYNLFYGNTTDRDGVITGTHSLNGDPRFVDPAHDDYHLLFGSSAIDHGVDAGVYTDLDGNSRPLGNGFDIGAYEFTGGTRYMATTGDDTSDLCLDQATPCATIQHAIDVANDGDRVLIASGLYTQSTTLDKPVSLTGVNSDTTIIHAIAGQRVLTVTGATITNSVVISGLTFMDGLADKGGGILIQQQALPIIRNSLLYNNRADQGGGLYSYGPVSMIDTRVISNGAIHGGGGAYAGMTATLTGGEFIANDSWADGGGAYLVQAAIITGTQFRNNHGSNGGGLFADLNTYPGPWVLTNTEFFGNAAQAGGGAALFGTSQITVQIDGGRFENNTSSTYGGGLLGDRVRLNGTRFISNSAVSSGGGALVYDASVTDSLFERNAISTGDGGGLMAHNLLLRHTTFVSNTASGNGGGLFASEAVTLTNVDFISNTAQENGGAVLGGPSFVTGGHFIDNHATGHNSTAGGLGTDHDTTISGTTFLSNSASFAGGGLYANYTATLYNTRFEANHTITYAGGLYAEHVWIISGTTFSNNSANKGGGAIIGNLSFMTNTTFISNSAAGGVGGLVAGSHDTTIANSLFARNSGEALNLSVYNLARILHTTIADPITTTDPGIHIDFMNTNVHVYVNDSIITNRGIGIETNFGKFYGIVIENYNLFYDDITNTIGVITGEHSFVGDPRFVDPTQDDYHLASDSAAIDHGVDAGVYTDLDGNPRPIGSGFDIGAYEYQGVLYRVFLPVLRR